MNTQGLAESVEDRIAHITAFNQRYWRMPRPLARILNPQNEINKQLLDLAEAISARAANSAERDQRRLVELHSTADRNYVRLDESDAVLRGLTEALLHDRNSIAMRCDGIDRQLSALLAGVEGVHAEIHLAQHLFEKSIGTLGQRMASIVDRLDGLESKVAAHEVAQGEARAETREALGNLQVLKADIEKLEGENRAQSKATVDRCTELGRLLTETIAHVTDVNAAQEVIRGDIAKELEKGNENRAQSKASMERCGELGQLLTETIARVADVKTAQEVIRADVAKELEKKPDNFCDDKFYLAFENKFRGSREEVVAKLNDYISLLSGAEFGAIGGRVLDLGCGRGEWLQLMRASGIDAYGVDVSPVMIEECARNGLEGVVMDALEHLRSIPDSSLRAITSFHLVEHVGLHALQELLAGSFRVLQPGGALILETPNPQNVIVGACNFYMDPTHRNPIPPMTLAFLVEYAGFTDVQVLPRNPFPPEHHFPLPRSATEEALDSFFFGARDYAVIARRPMPAAVSMTA